MGAKRVETCTWRDARVYFGAGDTPDSLKMWPLAMPAQMELIWSPTGKLKSWDVKGERDAFWEQAANAALQANFHRKDVVFRPDAIRRQGQSREESLLKTTVAWLEVQWPKDAASTWAPKTPITGPRYLKYGVASHETSYRKLEDGRWVLEGTITESVDPGTVKTVVAAVYAWDGDVMTGVLGDAIHHSSNVAVTGHRRNLVSLTTATDQSDPRPTQPPPALINTAQ